MRRLSLMVAIVLPLVAALDAVFASGPEVETTRGATPAEPGRQRLAQAPKRVPPGQPPPAAGQDQAPANGAKGEPGKGEPGKGDAGPAAKVIKITRAEYGDHDKQAWCEHASSHRGRRHHQTCDFVCDAKYAAQYQCDTPKPSTTGCNIKVDVDLCFKIEPAPDSPIRKLHISYMCGGLAQPALVAAEGATVSLYCPK